MPTSTVVPGGILNALPTCSFLSTANNLYANYKKVKQITLAK